MFKEKKTPIFRQNTVIEHSEMTKQTDKHKQEKKLSSVLTEKKEEQTAPTDTHRHPQTAVETGVVRKANQKWDTLIRKLGKNITFEGGQGVLTHVSTSVPRHLNI